MQTKISIKKFGVSFLMLCLLGIHQGMASSSSNDASSDDEERAILSLVALSPPSVLIKLQSPTEEIKLVPNEHYQPDRAIHGLYLEIQEKIRDNSHKKIYNKSIETKTFIKNYTRFFLEAKTLFLSNPSESAKKEFTQKVSDFANQNFKTSWELKIIFILGLNVSLENCFEGVSLTKAESLLTDLKNDHILLETNKPFMYDPMTRTRFTWEKEGVPPARKKRTRTEVEDSDESELKTPVGRPTKIARTGDHTMEDVIDLSTED